MFRRKKIITVEYHEEDLPLEPFEEPAFSEDEVEHLNLSLQKLDLKHREVLVLKFLEDMNYEGNRAIIRLSPRNRSFEDLLRQACPSAPDGGRIMTSDKVIGEKLLLQDTDPLESQNRFHRLDLVLNHPAC